MVMLPRRCSVKFCVLIAWNLPICSLTIQTEKIEEFRLYETENKEELCKTRDGTRKRGMRSERHGLEMDERQGKRGERQGTDTREERRDRTTQGQVKREERRGRRKERRGTRD